MRSAPFTIQRARELGVDLVDHFCCYCQNIRLDTGELWEVEPFQETVVEPVLYGVTETWAIIPEGNAKTTLMAGVALYFCDFTPFPWIPIGASTRDQAEILAHQGYQMVRATPIMRQRFEVYPGYREIRPIRKGHPGHGSRGIKVYAAEVGTADGAIPTLAICDEGHRHPDLGLYRLWKGKLNKRKGQIVMISTAGTPGSEFEDGREAIRQAAAERVRDGAHLRCVGPNIVMNEWRADAKKVKDMRAVKLANPLSTITEDTLRAEFESPTTDMGDWMRLKCNIPARTTGAAVAEAEWDERGGQQEAPNGTHAGLGIDVAWKHDTFASVPCWRPEGDGLPRRVLGAPEVLVPPRDGSMIHPDDVKAALWRQLTHFIVDEVVMDMTRAEEIAAWLEDQGIRVIDWSQGNVQKAEDYERFMAGLRTGETAHTGDPTLRAHVLHAIARPLPGDKRRFDRPSQARGRKKQDERVIDALDAASMINCFFASEDAGAFLGDVEDYRISVLC